MLKIALLDDYTRVALQSADRQLRQHRFAHFRLAPSTS